MKEKAGAVRASEKADVRANDKTGLKEMRKKEKLLSKKKLERVPILNGFVITTNRDKWKEHERI